MYSTITPPAANPAAAAGTSNSQPTRLAGFGALAFVTVVILQNVVRGSSAPGNGASASEVVDHFAGTRGITFLLVCMFVVSKAPSPGSPLVQSYG